MEKNGVGLIGVGGIMNGVHIPAYQACNDCEITAICDINPATLKRVGEKLGIPEENRFLCYEKLMDSGLVDIVDIATPDAVHCKIAQAAVDRNLPISVEKPMGMNYKEVKAVCDAANAKKLPGHVCFSWHYRPFVRLMREQIVSGKLGKLYHVYIRCIKDSGLWEGRRLEWRFDEKHSASGVMGDLCSHMFDIARFIGNNSVNSALAACLPEGKSLMKLYSACDLHDSETLFSHLARILSAMRHADAQEASSATLAYFTSLQKLSEKR